MDALDRIVVVGAGRLGSALAPAIQAAGLTIVGPLRRGEPVPDDATMVLLCVPDSSIADAASAVPPGPLVGHCSGATTLAPLAGHRAFSLHPLMTVPAGAGPDVFAGATAAIAGDPAAGELAERLRMVPIEVRDQDRAAYHAAASMASNFLITLESAAQRLAATAGLRRDHLGPLIRASVVNWLRDGDAALTGPIARGDLATVQRHRVAINEREPELLGLYDALAEATIRLGRGEEASS